MDETKSTAVLISVRRDAIRGAFLLAAVSLGCNIAALAVPLYNMEIFNRVMATHNLNTLVGLSSGLAIATLSYVVLDHLRLHLMMALGERFAGRALPSLLEAVQACWPRGPDPMQAIYDVETLRNFVGSPLLNYPFDLVWSPVLLLALLAMGWGYAFVGAGCVVILSILNLLGEAASRKGLAASNEASVARFREVAGAVRSAEAVIAMGILPALSRRWRENEAAAEAAGTRAMLRNRAVTAITRAMRSGMTGAIVATGLVLVLNGYASSGTLIAANMILARMLMPIEQFSSTLRHWADAVAAWRRVSLLLKETAPFRYRHSLPAPQGYLTVENLTYIPAGAERPILRGVSFKVEPADVVGVIGPSASGKSTLLRVVLGMAEATSGGAYLDGHSTYLWNREDFARHTGYVPQALALNDGTVAEIIARGAIKPEMDAVVIAAKRAGVHGVIGLLPNGYATQISSSGFKLSGGQRQRVAIARALYGNPKLIIMDEPNAFLDAVAEDEFVHLLEELRRDGVTTLIAAHRPSVLRRANKILVLSNGLVEYFGPASEVLGQMKGPKFRLVQATAS